MGGSQAPEQEGVGIENGRLRASWRRHHEDHGKAMLYGITRQWARDVHIAGRDILMNYDQYDQQDT